MHVVEPFAKMSNSPLFHFPLPIGGSSPCGWINTTCGPWGY